MRTILHIQNLKCGGCETTIVNRLSEIKNISDVEVNQNDETVSFEFYTNHDLEKAKHLLSTIGYPVVGAENKLHTKAKSYISCAIGKMHK